MSKEIYDVFILNKVWNNRNPPTRLLTSCELLKLNIICSLIFFIIELSYEYIF